MEGRQVRCSCSSCCNNQTGKPGYHDYNDHHCHENNPLWNQNMGQELSCHEIRNSQEEESSESCNPKPKSKNLYDKLKKRKSMFFVHKIIDIFKLIVLLALLITPSPTFGLKNTNFCNFNQSNWVNMTQEMYSKDSEARGEFKTFNHTMHKYISPQRYTYDMLGGRTEDNLKTCLVSWLLKFLCKV